MQYLASKVLLCLLMLWTMDVAAQTNVGVVHGSIKDPSGAILPGATVTLTNPITKYSQTKTTDASGNYQLVDVPFSKYTLVIERAGFEPQQTEITINSNLSQEIDLQLGVGVVNQVIEVLPNEGLLDTQKTGPSVVIDRNQILSFATAQPSRSTEEIIATAPGWTLDANGRLHARGIEYQVQYSIDGIPVTDTIASAFASAPDPRNFRSVEISTANISAEYGNKVAGVIAVTSRSGLEIPTSGSITLSGGSFSSFETAFDVGGHTNKFGFFASGAGNTTDRFLSPPAEQNFHNKGESVSSFFKIDYSATPKDLIRASFAFNGARFDVPNLPDQETEGQNQRRRLNDNMESISWQHIFSPKAVGYLAAFHRYNFAKLRSNENTGPVYSLQSRHYTTYGAVGSLTYNFKRNTIKTGFEFERFPVTESFTFAITDLAELLEMQPDLPPEVQNFTINSPFFFRDHKSGWEGSAYIQDHINLTKRLTLDVGGRFDSYHFLVDKNFFSPRVGIAYHVSQTKTVLRASYNRFLQTPALENLLLSSSDKARIFSPAGEEDMMMKQAQSRHQKGLKRPSPADSEMTDDMDMAKGAPVRPSRESQVDVGFQQQLSRYLRLDADFYYRRLQNPPEITNFLETGLIFPATLSRSRSKGVETRLDLAPVKGLSGFVSYTNLRISGFAPITGGLFLGEAVDLLSRSGQPIKIEEDQRNTVVFQMRYDKLPGKAWLAFGGRHDSGFSVELEPDASLSEFAKDFSPRILNQVNFDKGFIKPHTVLNLSVGKNLVINEHIALTGQFNIRNLANKFYLITFESVFSGTTIGQPRNYSGSLSINFK